MQGQTLRRGLFKISAPKKANPSLGHLFQECLALRVLSNIKCQSAKVPKTKICVFFAWVELTYQQVAVPNTRANEEASQRALKPLLHLVTNANYQSCCEKINRLATPSLTRWQYTHPPPLRRWHNNLLTQPTHPLITFWGLKKRLSRCSQRDSWVT